jgi:hypothetical protein
MFNTYGFSTVKMFCERASFLRDTYNDFIVNYSWNCSCISTCIFAKRVSLLTSVYARYTYFGRVFPKRQDHV